MNLSIIINKTINLYKINGLLISFPKSGNTYVRFIIANILIDCNNNEDRINFENIENIVPTYTKRKLSKNELNIFPVIAKSHFLTNKEFFLYKKFFRKEMIYILRNPLDTMKSYYIYRIKVENTRYSNFSTFIRDKNVGIIAWIKNIEKYLLSSSYLIIYEELLNNTQCELEKIIHYLNTKYNLNINLSIIPCVMKNTSKENMYILENNYKEKHKNGKFLVGGKVVENYSFVNLKKNRSLEISDSDIYFIKNKIDGMENLSLKKIILNNYYH